MWFLAVICIAFGAAWLPRQDKGPPLTEYGKKMAAQDSLTLKDSVARDSVPTP